ncbi:MAG: hypothetical protein RI841_07855 [Halomonas sp.]|uniref:hypothetical protein n=1 Tax=Halomonas sp. TaxID=1486246 RepID=UPI0028706711|nr:hypothetical protein [Halomonas sp.]MDR9439395.1 hypothetical protein [Halomonas sp.]
MVRFIFTLAALAGLAYGGLYVYYGMEIKHALGQRLDDLGLSAVEVRRVDFASRAPLASDTHVTAELTYGGAEASLDIRVIGHPLFSEETRLELYSLQALRLTLGTGG